MHNISVCCYMKVGRYIVHISCMYILVLISSDICHNKHSRSEQKFHSVRVNKNRKKGIPLPSSSVPDNLHFPLKSFVN